MTQKNLLARKKKQAGIKGSRFNVTCGCGQTVRTKINHLKPLKLFGQRLVTGSPVKRWNNTIKPQVKAQVNPVRCPGCQNHVTEVTLDERSQWQVTGKSPKKPSNRYGRSRFHRSDSDIFSHRENYPSRFRSF